MSAAYLPTINKELDPQLQLSYPNQGQHHLSRKDGRATLPGQPRVKLQGPDMLEYLRREHCVPELDKLAPWLNYVRWDSNPEQRPGLHLVWYYDRLFIKPIPTYMFSAAFWTWISTADPDVCKASVGFMRSYNYLILYNTDFNLARSPELNFIPVKCDFEDFVEFISQFLVGDEMVCPRYSLGQLRLSRLNTRLFRTWSCLLAMNIEVLLTAETPVMAKIVLGKFTYFHLNHQCADYLQKFVAPLVTVLLILSTLLSAMQVALSVQDSYSGGHFDRRAFRAVCVWFSMAVLIIVAAACLIILSIVLGWAVKDQVFAHRIRERKWSGSDDWREHKSGAI